MFNFNNIAVATRLLALSLLLLISGTSRAEWIEPGSAPALGENEGFALFDIDTDIEVEKIQLDRLGSIFSFPKIADLPAGQYTRLLKLPAGTYHFEKFETGWLYWEFEDVRNSKFTIEPGKINYVGEVRSRASYGFSRSLSIENTALVASRNFARDYPGLVGKYAWHYTGEFADPFMEASNADIYGKELPESGVEPRIEDRDAAEIIFRSISKFASTLSPDGRYVLETTSEGTNVAVRLIDLNNGSERVIYTGIPLTAARWLNPTTLALTMQTSEYQSKLLRVNSTEDVVEIPLALGWVIGNVPDGQSAIIAAPYNGGLHLKVVGIAKNITQKMVKNAPHLHRNVRRFANIWIDGQGKLRLYKKFATNKQEYSYYVYFDPTTEKAIEFKIKDEKNETFLFVGFDSKNKLLALTNRDRNEIELVEFNPADQTIARTVKSIKNTDLESVSYGTNNEVEGVRYRSSGRMVDASLENQQTDGLRKKLATSLPNSNIRVPQIASDGRALVYLDGPDNPGAAYIYQPSSSRIDLLTQSAPHLDGRPLAKTQRFIARAKDGFEIESFLTVLEPKSTRKHPLMVLPHGGPFGIVDTQRFDPEVQFFAKLGFAVLQVNFRGSGGTGEANRSLGIKQWGDLMIDDIETAADEALKKFSLDGERVVALGTSYGAYSAVRLAQRNPARYKTVVGIAGVYDLHMLFNSGAASRNERGVDWLKEHVGDPTSEAALLTRQSPALSAQLINAPVLLVHDRSDEIAPFEHTLRLQLALKRAKKHVELITVNDGDHGLTRSTTAIANYPKIARFLRNHLSSPPEQ